MKAEEIYLGLWMFLARDSSPHRPLAGGLHELFGLSFAGPPIEYSYSRISYFAVAAALALYAVLKFSPLFAFLWQSWQEMATALAYEPY